MMLTVGHYPDVRPYNYDVTAINGRWGVSGSPPWFRISTSDEERAKHRAGKS